MTVPRPSIKVKKQAVAQFLEIPTPSPKQLEYSSHSLTYEITHPYKNWQPRTRGRLSPSEMARSLVCGVCFSLNKSTSYLSLCLSRNSFCDETSRTWASLSPETRCVISVKRPWVRVPIWVTQFQQVTLMRALASTYYLLHDQFQHNQMAPTLKDLF